MLISLATLKLFLWGFFGSVALEIITATSATKANDGILPVAYRKPVFLTLRLFVAIISGFSPIIFEASNTIAAVYLGASTPIFFSRISEGLIRNPFHSGSSAS